MDLWETPGTPSDHGVPNCSIPVRYELLSAKVLPSKDDAQGLLRILK